ncbi:hypothetical protein FBEOM_7917 [Fusarium beomiforme]|uniref:Uncharacterized protein n=1 Tax=Fusarium beomiforme TaxID=44412 RepID=A0A9P5AGK0_9HYPO|nr:hypothetical protein FBEOM_7917 [Fusarium beomiforme]
MLRIGSILDCGEAMFEFWNALFSSTGPRVPFAIVAVEDANLAQVPKVAELVLCRTMPQTLCQNSEKENLK